MTTSISLIKLELNGQPKRIIADLKVEDIGCILEIEGLVAGTLLQYYIKTAEVAIILAPNTELSFKATTRIDVYLPRERNHH